MVGLLWCLWKRWVIVKANFKLGPGNHFHHRELSFFQNVCNELLFHNMQWPHMSKCLNKSGDHPLKVKWEYATSASNWQESPHDTDGLRYSNGHDTTSKLVWSWKVRFKVTPRNLHILINLNNNSKLFQNSVPWSEQYFNSNNSTMAMYFVFSFVRNIQYLFLKNLEQKY